MRLSIVICVHNYEAYLDQAIRSAVEQDYAEVEVVVVDDGSTDGSRKVIERWGDRVLPVFKENGGQVSAYNAGFRRASGAIVLFLDADDFLLPGAATRIVAAFTPGTVKVHYKLSLVDAHGVPTGTTIPSKLDVGDLRSCLLEKGVLYASAPGSGNAYRRSALARLMPIAENTVDRHGADLYTTYGVSLLGEVRTAGDQPLACHRMHAFDRRSISFGNASQVASPEPERSYRRYAHMRAWLLEKLGPEFEIQPRVRDFSLAKVEFANTIFGAPNYIRGFRSGFPCLVRRILPAIQVREGWRQRAGLIGWAIAVLVLPRPIGLPLARYVCNPGSRN